VELATYRVALQVVLPKLSQHAQSQLLDNLQQKAHATTQNPSSAAPSTTHSPRSFDDPSLKWS